MTSISPKDLLDKIPDFTSWEEAKSWIQKPVSYEPIFHSLEWKDEPKDAT
jgi:hypothetical protein